MKAILSEAEYAAHVDWCNHFWALTRFVAVTGGLPMPGMQLEGLELGDWVAAQRVAGHSHTPDQRLVLNALPAWSGTEGLVDPEWWQQFIEGGANCADWVAVQRANYRALVMPAVQAALLRTVPGWTWAGEQHVARWWAARDLLAEYVAATGKNPRDKTVYRGYCIGAWASNQRRTYLGTGTRRVFTAAALEAIPGWTWERKSRTHVNQGSWAVACTLLRQYVAKFGKQPARSVVYCTYKLGEWFHAQKVRYAAGGSDSLTVAQVAELEKALGACWKLKPADVWMQNYEQLVEHMQEHGKVPLQKTLLGRWVYAQRWLYNSRQIKPERTDLLEAIPGWCW